MKYFEVSSKYRQSIIKVLCLAGREKSKGDMAQSLKESVGINIKHMIMRRSFKSCMSQLICQKRILVETQAIFLR